MAHLVPIATYTNELGSLSVLDQDLPFTVRRVYYIYDVPPDKIRAGHRHRKNVQVLVCVKGCCTVYVNNGRAQETFLLDSPGRGLLLLTEDWHTMYDFSPDAVLLVLASEPYCVDDYIDEDYPS